MDTQQEGQEGLSFDGKVKVTTKFVLAIGALLVAATTGGGDIEFVGARACILGDKDPMVPVTVPALGGQRVAPSQGLAVQALLVDLGRFRVAPLTRDGAEGFGMFILDQDGVSVAGRTPQRAVHRGSKVLGVMAFETGLGLRRDGRDGHKKDQQNACL